MTTPTPTPPAEVDVAEGRRLLAQLREGQAITHAGGSSSFEALAQTNADRWFAIHGPALLDKIDTAAEQVAGLRETILSAANICEHWADESRNGGWSTHQIEPNRRLAASLRKAALGAAP